MTGHALPAVAEAVSARASSGITTMLPSDDAIWVGQDLARGFGRPQWQFAMSATDANRFVLRFADGVSGFLHLWALNRGVLLTPFHNMALLSPHHTTGDVDRHTEVFAEAVAALVG